MKTIKDAVIELGGKLPAPTCRKASNAAGWYISSTGKLTHITDCVWFEPEQFEAEAKRMGYINGYLWGKEYAINGKMPNLPHGTILEITYVCGTKTKESLNKTTFDFRPMYDPRPVSFRIVDERHKPAEEPHNHIVEASKKVDSSWYECGDRPPAGVECEVYNRTFGKNAEWEKCKILWRGEFLTVYSSGQHHECSASNKHLEFRQATEKTEREKVIEAAIKIDGSITKAQAESLYDAGMLVLPQKSGDTKD